MSRLSSIRPEFVEFVPKELEDGVLYVSIPYSTCVHRCACGCGSKITLPINPAKWRVLWDGERISLWPSVGNWSYPCRSHYWIEESLIEWAPAMSRESVEANRARDKSAPDQYLTSRGQAGTPQAPREHARRGLFDRIRGLFRR
jgi:hypothetical protein